MLSILGFGEDDISDEFLGMFGALGDTTAALSKDEFDIIDDMKVNLARITMIRLM